MNEPNLLRARRIGTRSRGLLAIVTACRFDATGVAAAAERSPDQPVRVAVYDAAPYGSVGPDGLFSGVSVELWRRVAEDLHLPYNLTLVPQMNAVLTGLEHGQFDAAVGAITITPEREARVDFSYPAHRSGVAVAFRQESGPIAALMAYAAVLKGLALLLVLILVLLLLIGTLVWVFERPRRGEVSAADSSVLSWFEGIYWAAVTMTTVGYGDKTPKTAAGRVIAVFWMLGSLALISVLSTSIVAQMTVTRIEGAPTTRKSDLDGKKLAAVADSSGAEYLDALKLQYTKYASLQEALASLASGKSTAVVNSIGALQYAISEHFSDVIAPPRGILAPAYMGFALPARSPLKKPIDSALIRITGSAKWRSQEESYFGD